MTVEEATILHKVFDGTYYNRGTPLAVVEVLEKARREQFPIRLHYGDKTTGLDWMEEHDIQGRIGRSMGPIKVPILLSTRRSVGGRALLDHCIVKITNKGKVLYKHPTYNQPTITWHELFDPDLPDYKFAVFFNGELRARFKTQQGMNRYVIKMKG